jgi:hypothetical protein
VIIFGFDKVNNPVWAIPQVMGLRLDGSLVLWAHLCVEQGTALRLFLDSGPSLGGLCQQAGPQTPGRASKLFFPFYIELVLFKFEDIRKWNNPSQKLIPDTLETSVKSGKDSTSTLSLVIHDARKTCKKVRYHSRGGVGKLKTPSILMILAFHPVFLFS